MRKIRIFACVALFGFLAASVWGEEAELLAERILRFTIAPSFGFQIQKWEGVDAEKVMLFNTGVGVEYGVNDWFTSQVLWVPGVNAWSQIDGGGSFGLFNDIYLGMKFAIVGEKGPVQRDNVRVSLAGGLIVPLPSTDGSDREGDFHLWSTAFKVYYDYIFTPLFYLDAYFNLNVYPNQRLESPNYATRMVWRPVDFTIELDPRFKYAIEGKGVVLHWGIPLTIVTAPYVNRIDDNGGMERMFRFGAGLFFTAAFVETKVPFDISLRYDAPIIGRYDQPVHRASLLGRIYVKL